MSLPLFITDCGIATPLGCGKAANAAHLFAGSRAGLRLCNDLLPGKSVYVGNIEAPLPPVPARLSRYDSRNNRLMLLVLQEISAAIEDVIARYGRHRVAVVLGSSTSGIAEGETALAMHRLTGHWPPSYDYAQQEPGSLAEFAALALGLTGPAYTVATACSSSAKVFTSARRLIRAGLADAAIVGGADTLCRMTLGGFGALQALSAGLCNPFSARRDGINIGEGAAAFVLSADPGSIACVGIGESSDAHHPTAPDPEGQGARLAVEQALADAGLTASDIAYVNLHGTGTPLNDAMESQVISSLFGPDMPCSSTKAMTGHMLGGTGACEAGFLWLTLDPASNPDGLLPPHLWDEVPDPALPPLALVAPGTRLPPGNRSAMLSTSFGFGGSNVALILARAECQL